MAHLFSSAGTEPPGSHVLLPLGVHPVTPCISHTLILVTGAMFDWESRVSLQNKSSQCLMPCVTVKVNVKVKVKRERHTYLSIS